jgi:glyoxylase-like metal-dependent hydrolase (beta-lactamase superfamily II)/rhodanese-related sulfurtransferase
MESIKQIDAATLRTWLENNEPVFVLDVRPTSQREEWQIPGSHYLDAYKRLNEGDLSVLSEIQIPEKSKVVTVCAAGRISQIASAGLREKGINAYSLKDGMKGWSLAWNKAILDLKNYKIIQLRRTGKGCLSYIIASDKKAIIVDASLPVEVYETVLEQYHWNLTAVLETHIHADHLSRSKQVAEKFKAPLHLPTPNKVSFSYEKLSGGQLINLGQIFIRVIATPGHTLESVSFLINDEILLSGDTVFTDAVGRPDLKANEEEAKLRAELLYVSLQKLMQLNENIIVLPAHTSKPIDFDNKPIKATLSEIRKNVPLLHLKKGEFVKAIMDKIPPAPANYLTIVEKNLSGNFTDINPIDLEAGANRCAIS